ncbi:carboxypeptidase regulatory-like domain-containing protein [Actinoplanes sp. GCM10030250]|uniref:carboxypeptidase regulatory-like domain-containing protein n=1 Tax=Actinoplanes sp. GCM10030250 TaxID=3273376 RepID=UPI00361CC304
MTTRLRAGWARAAALIALTGGTLAVAAPPVAAAPAPIRILSVSAENVSPGDKVRVQFRVTNTGSGAETAIVVVGGGLPCSTGCRAEPNLGAGKSKDFEATVVAPKAFPGEISGLNISVAVRLGGQNSFDYKMVYVHGAGTSTPGTGTSTPADKPPSGVTRVSGRVRDADGKAVGGVALTVRDSAGHEYRTTSNGSGRFSVKSSAAKPITKGQITVVAAMDGYRTTRKTVQGTAGDAASVQLTLAAVAAPTTTSPSPEATASPLAAADEASEPESSVAAAAGPDLDTVSDEGGSSLLFTILGGLLVAVGLGALARVMIRRRKTGGEPATPMMAPAAAGMGDAPTALLRTVPPADGFPGRYGAAPQGGGVQQVSHDLGRADPLDTFRGRGPRWTESPYAGAQWCFSGRIVPLVASWLSRLALSGAFRAGMPHWWPAGRPGWRSVVLFGPECPTGGQLVVPAGAQWCFSGRDTPLAASWPSRLALSGVSGVGTDIRCKWCLEPVGSPTRTTTGAPCRGAGLRRR